MSTNMKKRLELEVIVKKFGYKLLQSLKVGLHLKLMIANWV